MFRTEFLGKSSGDRKNNAVRNQWSIPLRITGFLQGSLLNSETWLYFHRNCFRLGNIVVSSYEIRLTVYAAKLNILWF